MINGEKKNIYSRDPDIGKAPASRFGEIFTIGINPIIEILRSPNTNNSHQKSCSLEQSPWEGGPRYCNERSLDTAIIKSRSHRTINVNEFI
jgi:hypothetical protein